MNRASFEHADWEASKGASSVCCGANLLFPHQSAEALPGLILF